MEVDSSSLGLQTRVGADLGLSLEMKAEDGAEALSCHGKALQSARNAWVVSQKLPNNQ